MCLTLRLHKEHCRNLASPPASGTFTGRTKMKKDQCEYFRPAGYL